MTIPSSTTINQRARGLIFDFALGAAIIALLPIPYSLVFKLLGLPMLMVWMLKRILRLWHNYRPDPVAKLGLIISVASALLLSLVAWLGGIALEVRVPSLKGIAPGLAFFALFWGVGQALNHCYLSGFPKTASGSSGDGQTQ